MSSQQSVFIVSTYKNKKPQNRIYKTNTALNIQKEVYSNRHITALDVFFKYSLKNNPDENLNRSFIPITETTLYLLTMLLGNTVIHLNDHLKAYNIDYQIKLRQLNDDVHNLSNKDKLTIQNTFKQIDTSFYRVPETYAYCILIPHNIIEPKTLAFSRSWLVQLQEIRRFIQSCRNALATLKPNQSLMYTSQEEYV